MEKKLWTGVKTRITTENGVSKVEVLESKWGGFNEWINNIPVNDTRKANEIFNQMQKQCQNQSF